MNDTAAADAIKAGALALLGNHLDRLLRQKPEQAEAVQNVVDAVRTGALSLSYKFLARGSEVGFVVEVLNADGSPVKLFDGAIRTAQQLH